MTVLFLSPHNDDETLFGAYTLLRERPTVVVCLWGTSQSTVSGAARVLETERALEVLGVDDFRQWSMSDTNVDAGVLELRMRDLGDFDLVFAPMVEDGGHEQHNLVGELARKVFPNVQGYATYRRGSGRTQTPVAVPFSPGWPALKLRAMACYESQIEIENTRPWFFDDDAYREWYEYPS
jgi:LmbE family N-acetylglucosaminyl deacetylase